MAEKILKVTFEANEQDIEKFNKLLKEAGINAQQLEDQMGKTGKETEGLTDTFNKVASAAKAFIAVAAVKEIFAIGMAASKAAAEVEGIESAFKNLGGTAQDINKLSAAVGGTQSKIALMKISIQGLQKGVGIDNLAKMLEFVDKQADATGQSFEALADTLINAVGKESGKGLQALGLNVQNLESNAKKLGFMPALLEEVGKQSDKLGDINDETADSYARLEIAQQDLQLALGKFINSKAATAFSAYWSELSTKAVKAFDEMLNGPDLTQKSLEELQATQATLEKEAAKAAALFGKNVGKGYMMSGIKDDALKRWQEYAQQLKDIQDEIAGREEAERIKKANAEQIERDKAATAEALAAEERAKKKKEEDDAIIKAEQEKADKILKIRADMDGTANAESQRSAYEREKARDKAAKDLTTRIKETDNADLLELPELPDVLGKPKLADATQEIIDGTATAEKHAAELAAQSDRIATGFAGAAEAAGGLVKAIKMLNDSDVSDASKIGSLIQSLAPILGMINPVLGGAAVAVGGIVGSFNEGGWVGGHGPDRDSVPAMLTPGEHVTRRRAAQRSALMLDAINSGELDDRMFAKLTAKQNISLDQSQVVEAINSIPVTDLYKSGSALYEHRAQVGKRNSSRHKRIAI